MGYYSNIELEQDLTSACGDLDRAFNGGPYVFDFYLDERSGLAECYIENEGKVILGIKLRHLRKG